MPCAALVQALGLPLRTASLPTLLGAGLQRGEASLEETGYVLRSFACTVPQREAGLSAARGTDNQHLPVCSTQFHKRFSSTC